jgi:peptide deformylase
MIRKILYSPHPVLRRVAAKVQKFDDTLQVLVSDMFETMYAEKGAGLAAPQIGVSLRVIVLDVSYATENPCHKIAVINPEIIAAQDSKEFNEGCLSVPGYYEKVTRPSKVVITGFDVNGSPFEIHAEDLLADCLQHEIDHLNGKLFIDMLSPLKRGMARRKVEKYKREHQLD